MQGVAQLRRILAPARQRQLWFIETLIAKDDWITLSSISETIGCSERVLKNDIADLNVLFAPFVIDTSRKNGIRIEYPINYSIDYIYTVFLQESIEFKLLEMLFSARDVSEADIYEALYISDSSLKRMINRINLTLEEHSIYITTKPYNLEGNELSIRNFITHYYGEKYPRGNLPYTTEQLEFITTLFKRFAAKIDITLNYPDVNQLRAATLANIIRMQQDYQLPGITATPSFEWVITELLEKPEIVHRFLQLFEIVLTPDSVREILFIFSKPDFVFNAPHLKKKVLAQPDTIGVTVTHIESFLTDLSNDLQIPIDDIEKLTFEIFNITVWSSGLNYILFDKKKTFLQYVSTEYTLFVNKVKAALPQLIFISDYRWKEASFNEFLYTIMIHWQNLTTHLIERIVPIKVGVFCDFDEEHSHLIIDILNHHFGAHVNSQVLQSLEEEEALIESADYDVILTTISNMSFQSKHTICINSIPTIHDWKTLQKIISYNEAPDSHVATKFISF